MAAWGYLFVHLHQGFRNAKILIKNPGKKKKIGTRTERKDAEYPLILGISYLGILLSFVKSDREQYKCTTRKQYPI